MVIVASFLRFHSDGSGSIDRNEFLQIPQIANNPLSSRMIAIFDEEYENYYHTLLPDSSVWLIVACWLAVAVARSTFKNSSEG